MATQSPLDEHDTGQAQALMARQLLNITDTMDTMAVTDDLDSGQVQQIVKLGADDAHQLRFARLIEQLRSVEFSIYDLELTEPNSEFERCLKIVVEELKQRRKGLASLFNKTRADQQAAHWSEDVIRELDGLTRLLMNFRPSLDPIQSTSDSRWDQQNMAKNRFQKLISAPPKPKRALEEARNSVSAVMGTLARLQASTQPAAALDDADADLAETSRQGGWI
ncbi:hypothetical protein F5B18DRAFT_626773 [Nemania serpens]|nr:hypothetical protein F5B18DRAFT_626773 [Nemania serpens]